jgi:hypothetical protein
MKPSAYSPFGGGKKPVAAIGSDSLYAPPLPSSSMEAVDTVSLSPASATSSSTETMFYTDSMNTNSALGLSAFSGDDLPKEEGVVHGANEYINGYQNEASISDEPPSTGGDPLQYTSMPTAPKAPFGKTSYSPFGSKPKASSSSSNDSLYSPP